jgi:hypothetical protein
MYCISILGYFSFGIVAIVFVSTPQLVITFFRLWEKPISFVQLKWVKWAVWLKGWFGFDFELNKRNWFPPQPLLVLIRTVTHTPTCSWATFPKPPTSHPISIFFFFLKLLYKTHTCMHTHDKYNKMIIKSKKREKEISMRSSLLLYY